MTIVSPNLGNGGQAASLGSKIGCQDTSRDWERRVEGFREHIAVDGSLKGVSGRDAARGLADYVKDSEPWAMLAEMEV